MVVWRDKCPQCGRLKDKRSELCQYCRREANVNPRRKRRESEKDLCPQCGNEKHKRSALCAGCWRQNILKHPERLVPCPSCGDLKDVRSKLCHKCHFNSLHHPNGERLCRGCNKLLDDDRFGYSNKRANRRRSRCRECESKAAGEWRKKNKAKAKQNKKQWNVANPDRIKRMGIRRSLRKIGVAEKDIPTLVEYVINTKQCNICGSNKAGSRGRWRIDHIHGTNIVRGVLCDKCNTAIGLFGDTDPDVILAASKYVRNPGWRIKQFLRTKSMVFAT